MKSWTLHLATISGLVVLTFGAYANSLGGGFLWDDHLLIEHNPLVHDWANLPAMFVTPLTPKFYLCYRPAVNVFFASCYAFWGLQPFGYHLTGVLVHAVNAALVYGLLWGLSQRWGLAASAGALFAVHALLSEPVNYVASRADLLAGASVLAGMICYIRARGPQGHSRRWLAAALVCFAVGLLSKELVLVLPVLMLAYEWIFQPAKSARWIPRTLWPFVILGGIYVVLRMSVLSFEPPPGFQPSNTIGDLPATRRIATALTTLPIALRLFLLPTGLHKGWLIQPVGSLSEPAVVFGGLVVVACTFGAVILARRSKLMAFGLAWFMILMAPHLNVIPLHAFMSEGWLYLPTVGLILVALLVVVRIFPPVRTRNRVILKVLLVGAIGGYGLLTVVRNRVWAGDPLDFYADILHYNPYEDRIHNEMGNTFFTRGNLDQAEAAYQRAHELNPGNPTTVYNLGLVRLQQQRLPEALHAFQQTLELEPTFGKAQNNLGLVHYQQRKFEQAAAAFQRAIELDPMMFEPYVNLGNLALATSELKRAASYFQMAIERNPSYAPAHHHLGTVYIRQGRSAEAVRVLTQAAKLAPHSAVILNDLASLAAEEQRWREAMELYERALTLQPGYAQAHYNLGVVLIQVGRAGEAIQHLEVAIRQFRAEGQERSVQQAEAVLTALREPQT